MLILDAHMPRHLTLAVVRAPDVAAIFHAYAPCTVWRHNANLSLISSVSKNTSSPSTANITQRKKECTVIILSLFIMFAKLAKKANSSRSISP